jgi:DnaJ-class molecular chaperone
MADDLVDCPVCDGLGYVPCDDGSELQCAHCDGTGKVPVVQAEPTAGVAVW